MKVEDFNENAPGQMVPIVEAGERLHAFAPDPIPRDLHLPNPIVKLAEEAGVKLGMLFVDTDILNPVLPLFLRREAIASNAIEGTITTARQLYLFESAEGRMPAKERQSEEQEVANYVSAVIEGMKLLQERPMSLNIIHRLHAILLDGVRGKDKLPGRVRTRQNAISTGDFISARYVPPPPSYVMPALTDLEEFIHEEPTYPDSVRAALVHYQFEAIHPYLDGNGRMGRLLIPLLLCTWNKLPGGFPRLYLSKYFEQHDGEYRDLLLSVSQEGNWVRWIEFFLNAIVSEAQTTLEKCHELTNLQSSYIERVKSGPGRLQEIIRNLFTHPVLKISDIRRMTGVSHQQARNYAITLVDEGILIPDEEKSWGRPYYAGEILHVFFN